MPMSYDSKGDCAVIHDSCRFKDLYEITMSGNDNMIKWVRRIGKEYNLRTGNGNGDNGNNGHKRHVEGTFKVV
jgi:hypothetical protein